MDLLTRMEEMLLVSIFRLGDDAYGVTIRQELERLLDKSISVGAIYVPLDRLTKRGYLQSYQGDPTPERGGRSKRFYRVTQQGRAALEQTRQLSERLWSGLPDLLEVGNMSG